MRTQAHAQLLAIARRQMGSGDAEDVVQEALLAAVRAGRHDLEAGDTPRWLMGVVRNKARMAARTARRRRTRDDAWGTNHAEVVGAVAGNHGHADDILTDLPPALRSLAALVLTGHSRREIAYLLQLPDTALRQRISALKKHLRTRGIAAPDELGGLNLDLAYGRIRDALLPSLMRHGGIFAAHDPDGHLFLLRRSQT